jgi:transcriptional regulator with XRE-family HTH domain
VKLLSDVALVAKLLTNKAFRDAYVYEHVRNGVSFQIRAMREEKGWTQGKLGEISEKPRNVITRLEDPNYGKLTIRTLLEIASAFDVALLVKFVPFSRLLREYEDTSPSALVAANISKEAQQLGRWARVKGRLDANVSETETLQLSLQWDQLVNPADAAGDPPLSEGNVIRFPIRLTGSIPISGTRYDNAQVINRAMP